MRARPRLPGDRPRHVPAAALAAARRTPPGNPPAPSGPAGRAAVRVGWRPPRPGTRPPRLRLRLRQLRWQRQCVSRAFLSGSGGAGRWDAGFPRGLGRCRETKVLGEAGGAVSSVPGPSPARASVSRDSRQRRRGRGVQLGVPVIDRDGSLSHLSSLRTQAGVQPLPGGGEGDPREELSGRHFWGQLWLGGRAEQRPQAQRQVGGWGRPSLSCWAVAGGWRHVSSCRRSPGPGFPKRVGDPMPSSSPSRSLPTHAAMEGACRAQGWGSGCCRWGLGMGVQGLGELEGFSWLPGVSPYTGRWVPTLGGVPFYPH